MEKNSFVSMHQFGFGIWLIIRQTKLKDSLSFTPPGAIMKHKATGHRIFSENEHRANDAEANENILIQTYDFIMHTPAFRLMH